MPLRATRDPRVRAASRYRGSAGAEDPQNTQTARRAVTGATYPIARPRWPGDRCRMTAGSAEHLVGVVVLAEHVVQQHQVGDPLQLARLHDQWIARERHEPGDRGRNLREPLHTVPD